MGVDKVLGRLVEERDRLHETIDEVLEGASSEDRDPSEAEKDLLVRHKARLDQLEPEISQLVGIEETRRNATDARAMLTRGRRGETPAPPDDDDGDDGGEGDGEGEGDGVYRTFAQYARDEILVRHAKVAALAGPRAGRRAQERLTRAVPKVLTADVPGILQPQYVAEIMQKINKARPLVDLANSVSLASGTLQWPNVTNKPDVAKQATEKTEAGDGAMTVAMLSKVASTYLVAANFSWQTIQWANPDALQLWFDLAAASYARQTDAEAAAVLAAHDSTPATISAGSDLAAWMAAITAAAGEVYAQTGRYANGIAADPATGYKLAGLVSAQAPVFLATGGADLSAGSFPNIGGLRFVISAGLPATTVIVGDFDALLVAETAGSPVESRAVEPSIGGLEIGLIGAFATAVTDAGAFAEINPSGA